MKPRRTLLPLVSLLAAALVAADKPASPPVGVPAARFKLVRERAAALFQLRDEKPPAPEEAENPFATVIEPVAASPRPAEPGPAPAKPRPAASDQVRLNQAVASLRASGMFEKDGETYAVFNSKPYRIGEQVKIMVSGAALFLRVREVTRQNVTLTLNESEVTVRFGRAPR